MPRPGLVGLLGAGCAGGEARVIGGDGAGRRLLVVEHRELSTASPGAIAGIAGIAGIAPCCRAIHTAGIAIILSSDASALYPVVATVIVCGCACVDAGVRVATIGIIVIVIVIAIGCVTVAGSPGGRIAWIATRQDVGISHRQRDRSGLGLGVCPSDQRDQNEEDQQEQPCEPAARAVA
jgi:hypothetical protein